MREGTLDTAAAALSRLQAAAGEANPSAAADLAAAIAARTSAPVRLGTLHPTDGHGTYVAGEKVGRNDPCPCGSGVKAKRCSAGHPAGVYA